MLRLVLPKCFEACVYKTVSVQLMITMASLHVAAGSYIMQVSPFAHVILLSSKRADSNMKTIHIYAEKRDPPYPPTLKMNLGKTMFESTDMRGGGCQAIDG